jgi:LysM repeat protein
MKMKSLLFVVIILFVVGVAWISSGVQAAPGVQQVAYPSPTPGPDGRIIYIVKAGDTCEQISLMYGVSLEYLRLTNQLDQNCSLREGQQLMLGVGGPSSPSPTPGPSQVPTAILPTATPETGGNAEVCVLVYDDLNGDGLRQTTEKAIAGAALSLTSLDGTYSQTLTTSINPDPDVYQGMCFTNVPKGEYNVSAAAPDGYNPTINLSSTVDVTPGDTAFIDYGAQLKTGPEAGSSGEKTSPLLGILGALFLLGGIGLAVYVFFLMKKK